MARNGWSRWGRGICEGYSLRIGSGNYARFEASVLRVMGDDGNYYWRSDLNGACEKRHATMLEGMARAELELTVAGCAFVEGFEEYKVNRSKSRYSQAVDAARNGTIEP